jgi:DNA-binding winged helix-turn-helix (wHTH) protein
VEHLCVAQNVALVRSLTSRSGEGASRRQLSSFVWTESSVATVGFARRALLAVIREL